MFQSARSAIDDRDGIPDRVAVKDRDLVFWLSATGVVVDRCQCSWLGGRFRGDVQIMTGRQAYDGVPVGPGSPYSAWYVFDDHGAEVVASGLIQG